jgi:hypothetical protein
MQRFILVIALLISPLARAELVDHGHYTTDTDTGLDWLDLPLTAGMSIFDFSNGAVGAGLRQDGWRSATDAEIQDLFGKITGHAANQVEIPDPTYLDAVKAIGCLGATRDDNSLGGPPGFFSEAGLPITQTVDGHYQGSPGLAGTARLVAIAVDAPPNPDKFTQWFTSPNVTSERTVRLDRGIFLVRETHNPNSLGPKCREHWSSESVLVPLASPSSPSGSWSGHRHVINSRHPKYRTARL